MEKKHEIYRDYACGTIYTWKEEYASIIIEAGKIEKLFEVAEIEILIDLNDSQYSLQIFCEESDVEKAEKIISAYKKGIINLTPHQITVCGRVIEPSGIIARCSEVSETIGTARDIPIVRKSFGEITGLPDPLEDNIYVVSRIVAEAARRSDVLSPGDPVRDTDGKIIGCKSLCSYV